MLDGTDDDGVDKDDANQSPSELAGANISVGGVKLAGGNIWGGGAFVVGGGAAALLLGNCIFGMFMEGGVIFGIFMDMEGAVIFGMFMDGAVILGTEKLLSKDALGLLLV